MPLDNSLDNAKGRYTQGGETEAFDQRMGWWERDLETLRQNDNDIFIIIQPKYDKRPDLFAADFYGSSLLMWLVLQFNNIVDINEEFVQGKEVRLPATQRVLFDFLNKRTGGVVPRSTSITS